MPEKEGGDSEWLAGPAFLLPRFNTLHALAHEQVKFEDVNAAKNSYRRMLELYDEINRSGIPAADKQAAYKRLMEVFSLISTQPAQSSSSIVPMAKYLFPISLVVIVLLIVIFAKPEFSLTGLIAGNQNMAPEWTGGNTEFIVQGQTQINLDIYF